MSLAGVDLVFEVDLQLLETAGSPSEDENALRIQLTRELASDRSVVHAEPAVEVLEHERHVEDLDRRKRSLHDRRRLNREIDDAAVQTVDGVGLLHQLVVRIHLDLEQRPPERW